MDDFDAPVEQATAAPGEKRQPTQERDRYARRQLSALLDVKQAASVAA